MSMMTEKDSLEYGIEYPPGSGELHYDFEIRLGTIGENIEVYEQPEIIGGGVSNMRVNVAMLARCLVSLGTIPKEAITDELLSTAIDSDYDVMMKAQDELKKKRKRPNLAAETSGSPDSSSPSMASAKSGSEA
ncbi:hypothetical protein [Burkholderia cepacia]|uniref:Phage tail assembly protein n=1 Tax=Burkholderia cepacia TaxID=292 RepID=A0AAX2RVZ0_BURCE|nr:hypothetical protein [Burkholderia cepacia]TET04777.1 hypothetical protein E3D36_04450 [Burkholderia cepacia]TEU51371.1 hypothetical protein E3D37_08090 [Burkholderia cepacia]TEU56005.1 hypothetical protein E3D38_07360 [Burkholderia cepacia]TEV01212.1 hypothetical protein E3D40_14790 [Burkholderia cepacia]TEV11125.1 hypothetical protein E3D44_08085 [Burkholderia cepacia]